MYKKYLELYFKSTFQYRGSTILMFISQMFITAGEFVAVWLLMERFNNIGGWNFYNVAIMFGLIIICFPLAECVGRGFDTFSKQIKSGEVDRLFLRPRPIFWQVFCAEFDWTKLGKALAGIVTLIIGLIGSNITWTFSRGLCLALTIVCGFLIQLSILIFNGGITIFTVEESEFYNIATNGGRRLAQYPISIYNKAIRIIFTFILPFACINYLPVSYIIGLPSVSVWVNMLSPVWGSLIIIPATLFFNFSLKFYKGSGT